MKIWLSEQIIKAVTKPCKRVFGVLDSAPNTEAMVVPSGTGGRNRTGFGGSNRLGVWDIPPGLNIFACLC